MKLRVTVRQAAGLLVLCLGLSMLALLPAGAFLQRGDQIRIEGRVRNVREQGRRFVLETGRDSYDVEYPRGGAGFGFNVANLREGDRLRVEGNLVGTRLVEARKIQVLSRQEDDNLGSGSVSGRVSDVDVGRRRFTVQPDRGSSTRVSYDRDTTVRGLDRNDPSRLRNGDRVRVDGRWAAREMLEARRIEVQDRSGPDSNWRSGDTGRVQSIDRSGRRLRVRFGRETYDVDVRDADIRGGGRRLRPTDLRSGDQVRIFGDLRNGEIRADRVRRGE
jgi:Domain of unknown function (DUF5666)